MTFEEWWEEQQKDTLHVLITAQYLDHFKEMCREAWRASEVAAQINIAAQNKNGPICLK